MFIDDFQNKIIQVYVMPMLDIDIEGKMISLGMGELLLLSKFRYFIFRKPFSSYRKFSKY